MKIDIFYLCLIILKCVLFQLCDTIDTSWMPFFTTQYVKQENILEAKYLSSMNVNPYNTQLIFQKPLLVFTLFKVNRYFYLIIDILIGHLLQQVSEKQGYKKVIKIFYHLNPITFISLLALNTDGIDYLLLLTTIILTKQVGIISLISPILFGTLLYLNPQYFIVISTITLIHRSKYNNSDAKFYFSFLLYLVVTSITIIALLYQSYLITGDWNFIQKCYFDLYFPLDHRPTIGFLWAVLSGLFSKYKILYHALYMIFPLCYILPFYNLFKKFDQLSIGLMLGITLFSSFLYFQHITIMNLFIIFALILSRYDLVFNNITAMPVLATGSFITFLAARLQYLWTNSPTGNPNFPFFQIFVSYIFFVTLASETTREMLIDYAKRKLEQKKLKQD